MMIQSVFFLVAVAALAHSSHAFSPVSSRPMTVPVQASSALSMGFFDGIMKAFDNASFSSGPAGVSASARHILVKQEPDAFMILEKLKEGEPFMQLARDYSFCPSSQSGGSLGNFKPGTMVPAFDEVIFNPETALGQVVGPVRTTFGYHLIVVDKRTGVDPVETEEAKRSDDYN